MKPDVEPQLAAQRDAIAALCRAHGVLALEVFGSAADGRFDPARSDYDFIARFAPDESRSLARRFVAFSEALEVLLGRPVDVMTDHPIENPYLRAAVAATRRLVYAESPAQTPA
jgi:predicted nucleotidyltransferase